VPPHDQYYFGQPQAMVSGIVRPPALDLANRDLVEAHLHAVWLADSTKELTFGPTRQRVVPIVQDNKNALLLQLPGPALPETAMSTLQHALTRGLEVVFQLEEGEILTEPVPARDRRRGILFFEATEGGAGVLGRLTSDPTALSQVARAALDLMHYDNIDAGMAAAAPDVLTEVADARCIAGCYRCLLSYYNQPVTHDMFATITRTWPTECEAAFLALIGNDPHHVGCPEMKDRGNCRHRRGAA
jgi:hypothetical protein